ncbi:hypothetical protein JCM10207_007879 [Rhodosporidiobolus poonsookiae]
MAQLPVPFDAAFASLASSQLPPRPVASTSAGETIRCSQCKKNKPSTDFPLRLINLQPFQVCFAHDWYWTPAKRATSWAPAETKGVEQVCNEVRALASGVQGAVDRWMVHGGVEDRMVLVQRIAAAGGWTAKPITLRKSGAKNEQPHPTFQYSLAPPDEVNPFRLTLYYHADAGKYTLTVRPEDKGKVATPWARPNRVRAKKEDEKGPLSEADEGDLAVPEAMQALGKGKQKAPGGLEPNPNVPLDILVTAASSVAGETPPTKAPAKPKRPRGRGSLSRVAPLRSEQEMPPPPVPPPRPPKKARRVEPSLVSPAVAPGSAPTAAPSSSATSWANFLSFPTELPNPPQAIPSPSEASTPGDAPTPTSAPFDYSSDDTIAAFLESLTPSGAVPVPTPSQPITLADLLASPYFDPPIIPLPPRQHAPAGAHPAGAAVPSHHSHGQAHASAPRVGSRLRESTSAQEQAQAAAANKMLDDAAAAVLGLSPHVSAATPGTHGVDTPGDDEDDEDYYEDSIPDDSSSEEGEGEGEEGDGRDRSGSSFFESSAEEQNDGDSGSEAQDEDEEEGDWLAGFVSRQMPGLSEQGGEGKRSAGATPRARGDDGEEVDELDELESEGE